MNPYHFLKGTLSDRKYVCPYCEKQFKSEYPSKTILGDWKHNAQLAYSNFTRHLKSHDRKGKTTKKRD